MNIDIGSTGFMLLATSLVMFMTPGLAFFYGGLVSRKNVLTIMFQSYISLGVTTILWFLFGYSMCFSGSLGHGDIGGIIGNFDMAFFRGVDLNGASPVNPSVPLLVFVSYQMMFAIITPALITGAFANRVRFPAYLVFLVGWLALVYFPFVHMVWGGGLLASLGVRDFAGGIVVHTTAGFAALASVLYVGKRRSPDKGMHSLPLVALGTAILWFGWYGFNAGSEFGVNRVTALAFLNTDVAASFAGPTWLLLDWIFTRKPKFLGFLTGSVAGLATITPCAGYVTTGAAVLIGIIASLVCYLAVNLKNKTGLDDALDVFGVHGVGGMTGTILLGVFGSSAATFAGRDPALLAPGLLEGNWGFFLVQIFAVVLAAVYAFLFTLAMLWLINRVTPVRVSAKDEATGLDVVEHGESAYI